VRQSVAGPQQPEAARGAVATARQPARVRSAPAPSIVRNAANAANAAVAVVPAWLWLLIALLAGASTVQAAGTRRERSRRTRERMEARATTVRALAAAVAARDRCTGRHIERVSELGLLLAERVVPRDLRDPQLAWGFLLHDVGKLSVPDAVLQKPGRLDEVEAAIMRTHPESGARILEELPFLERATEVVRHHHERWDGGGYPAGLRGEQIPLWARIFAIADSVDAMTSDRPYRRGRTLDEALDVVRGEAGRQFDPACVEAFLRLDRARVAALLEDGAAERPRARLAAVA
jgi:ribonuclease P protein subunit RPR2